MKDETKEALTSLAWIPVLLAMMAVGTALIYNNHTERHHTPNFSEPSYIQGDREAVDESTKEQRERLNRQTD